MQGDGEFVNAKIVAKTQNAREFVEALESFLKLAWLKKASKLHQSLP